MFRKILIPHDGSAITVAVEPILRAIAQAGTDVILLQVVPIGYPDADAYRDLERLRDELSIDGLSLDTRVSYGDPAEQIVEVASTENVDLLVMATYGLAGFERLVAGGVSQHVVAMSPVPVLVVTPNGRGVTQLRRILVPTDGTAGSALALGAALPIARSSGASVTLLEVTQRVPRGQYHVSEGGELGVALDVGQAYEEAARVRAEDYVTRMAGRLAAKGFDAAGVARVGDPAPTIVEYAEQTQADLIVMSTRRLRGPARAIHGSVADKVVELAPTPLLLVPRSEPFRD